MVIVYIYIYIRIHILYAVYINITQKFGFRFLSFVKHSNDITYAVACNIPFPFRQVEKYGMRLYLVWIVSAYSAGVAKLVLI